MFTLRWPQFSLFVLAVYLGINQLFGLAYYLRPHCIAEMVPRSWEDAFFFSVETLATVGYGHMYPATLYGHVVATAEIMTGMFGLAIITGLIFIRFSRPIARVVFSDSLADLEREDTRFTAWVFCIDTVIPAAVQSHRAYTWRNIKWNHRFAEVYQEIDENSMSVDYSLIHATEASRPSMNYER